MGLGLLAACAGSDSAESQPASEATSLPSAVVPVTPTPVPPTPQQVEAAAPPPAAVPSRDQEQQPDGASASSAQEPRSQRAREAQAIEQQAPPSGDIRDVDFDNYSYTISFDDDVVVTTIDGEYADDEGYLWLSVRDVVYGDLDDDGDEEAVVTTTFHTGGSGRFGMLNAYGIDGDSVVLRATLATGDRADGGLAYAEIADGQLIMGTFATDQGACCPNMLFRQKRALGATGLVATESLPLISWLTLDDYDGADELRFLPGTSGASVRVFPSDTPPTMQFEAAEGQWLNIDHRRGPRPNRIEVVELATQTVFASQAAKALEAELPSSGDFEVRFFFGAVNPNEMSLFDVTITSEPVPEIPLWTTALREIVVATDPEIALTAAWPQFDTSDGGQLNFEIQQWLAEETDWWVAGALEFPPPDDWQGGEYELTFTMSLVAEDLVSVHYRYYEYLCCRPYPNYGQKSLLLDLANRRVIPADEVLDLDRLTEVHDVWFEAAARDPELGADLGFWLSSEHPAFTSLALVPGGVEFGTDRQGAMSPTSTFVSWAELGDLANADIVARTVGGVTPTDFPRR